MTAATTESRVLTALADGPATAREIGARLGLTALAVRPVLNDLLRRRKVSNDGAWLRGRASTWSRDDA